jgi:hypothetical protein
MDDKSEILWRMYNEHVIMGRHHETQRSTMSQIILAVAGALVGFLEAMQHLCKIGGLWLYSS